MGDGSLDYKPYLLVPDLSAPGTGIPEAPTARGSPDRMLSKCRKKEYELNVNSVCNQSI